MKQKRTWKKVLAAAVIAAIILIALLPFPQKINTTLYGVQGIVGDAASAASCTIEIKGTCYRYLLKPDTYFGRLAISTIPDTMSENVQLQSSNIGSLSALTYHTEDGYKSLGIFFASSSFDQLLIHINESQGGGEVFATGQTFVLAPADSYQDAKDMVSELAQMNEAIITAAW